MSGVLERIRGGLVVSCQAAAGTPLHGPAFTAAMAASTVAAGAVGVRVDGPGDVVAVRRVVDVPVVGLWKDGDAPVYITPTARHAAAVADAGADVVAVDGTTRPRPDGAALADSVRAVHARGALVMADVATLADGRRAQEAGADLVSTTLSGYTAGTARTAAGGGPDLGLVTALSAALAVPVVAEGRIRTPEEAAEALARGAWAVVVGTAITAPGAIAARFVQHLGGPARS